jgi:alanine dehydrogenase
LLKRKKGDYKLNSMTEKKKTGFDSLVKAELYTQEKLQAVKTSNKKFFIGLPNEISLNENRICLTPDAVALLVNNGHEVWVEARAGEGSKFSDKQYSEAGAKLSTHHRRFIKLISSLR